MVMLGFHLEHGGYHKPGWDETRFGFMETQQQVYAEMIVVF